MKKIIAAVLLVLLTVTTVFAGTLPSALTDPVPNYTADLDVSLKFDNSEELVELLRAMEMPEEVEYFVDMPGLLESLFSYDGKMNIQADFSENYDIIKLAATSESDQTITANPNLSVDINSKTGIWVNMDISNAEKPVLEIICIAPILNKYMVIDASEYLDAETIAVIKGFVNKESIETLSKSMLDIIMKHVKVEALGSKYTVTIDNDGLIAYCDEAVPELYKVIFGIYAEMFPEEFKDVSVDDMLDMLYGEEGVVSYKDMKLLGEDGMKMVYTLSGGKISTEEVTADFSIDLANMLGDETIDGTIDFTVSASGKYTDIGTTKVVFPELTEENSFSYLELTEETYPEDYIPEEEYPEDYAVYPNVYAGGYCDNIEVIDGKVYVPLRTALEGAYDDTISITYNNGLITAVSEYFGEFQTLSLTVGDTKAYADDVEYEIGEIILKDGVTYVDADMFVNIFGWELTTASYDFVYDEYYFSFYTYASFFYDV